MRNIYNGEQIQTEDGLEGVLFRPEATEPAGSVIILHERYGLSQHTIDLAHKLSFSGLVAYAPNLFAGREGMDAESVRSGAKRIYLTDTECYAMIARSIDFLKAQSYVDERKLTVMGVCQSGRYPLVAGSRRGDLAALVVFYGAASDKEWYVSEYNEEPMEEMIARVKVPSFHVFGEKDHIISLEHVRRYRNAFEAANKSYRMKLFKAVPHGFLNDTMPGRYRAEETRESWQMLIDFLHEVYADCWPENETRWQFDSCFGDDYDFTKNVRLE